MNFPLARIYTRAFRRWIAATRGRHILRTFPWQYILTLEMMRLRSPLRHVRLFVHDPHGRLILWTLAYATWINTRIRPGADPLVIRPGPSDLRLSPSDWPGLRFASLKRPDAIRGTTTDMGIVLCAHTCGPRSYGHDLFERVRTALTPMVNLSHSLLIFHGDARVRRRHFRGAWLSNREHPTDTHFLCYDHEHPDAILATLAALYRRPVSESRTPTAATASPAPPVSAPVLLPPAVCTPWHPHAIPSTKAA